MAEGRYDITLGEVPGETDRNVRNQVEEIEKKVLAH